jgi:serine O-acetyltransferase
METWQPLLVPTVSTADGLMRVAENDSRPIPLVTRPSATEPDWSREQCQPFQWIPGRQVVRALRDYAAGVELGGKLGKLRRKVAVMRHRFWSAVAGMELPLNARNIAGGLLIPHPNGVVVHPDATIGPNCVLFQQVTLGTGPRPGLPDLGGGVEVGPGAKVLGGVTVGDFATIGANAVVIDDVPPGAVAVGIPAVIKRDAKRTTRA